MIQYHLISMGIKVSKSTHVFVEKISLVLNVKNPGSTLNKETLALSYHFLMNHVDNNVVEVSKIYTSNNFSDPFTKPLVSNDFHGFLR